MACGAKPINRNIANVTPETKSATVCTVGPHWTEDLFKYSVQWLSCNGEAWGLGPTVVFSGAAALCLYNEMETALINSPPPRPRLSFLERTLLTVMVAGMLALMVHLWVCCTLFIQYYLDAFITNSPNVLLEMTATGLLGPKADALMLAPLTRFLRQQQPQIHITLCWFLALCYADYVRTHHCQYFTVPYLTDWQREVEARLACLICCAAERVNNAVTIVQQRLHRCCFPNAATVTAPPPPPQPPVIPSHQPPGQPSCCTDSSSSAIDKHSQIKISKSRSLAALTSIDGSTQSFEKISECDSCLSCPNIKERMLNPPRGVHVYESTADALNSLKTYIKATRCSCREFRSRSQSILSLIKKNKQ